MVNAPPCAACSYPLRWIPESNGWGCDRCRQFYPAQPQPQPPPQQPWAPQQQPHQQHQQPGYGYSGGPVTVPGGGSKIGLWVVLALLVVAGGVVGLVFALRGGGGGGTSSPEALIKATLAAEAAGDADALVQLSDPEGLFASALDCKGEAARDEGIDPKQQLAKLKPKMDELVKKTKGLAIELVESKRDESDRESSVEPGKEVAPGCTAKAKLESLTYKIQVKTTKDGKSRTQDTLVTMMSVGGHYYLLGPPRVKPPGGTTAFLDDLAGLRDKVCKCADPACAETVHQEWEARHKQFAGEASDAEYADLQKKDAISKDYFDCRHKLGL